MVNVSDQMTLEALTRSGLTPHFMTERYQLDISQYAEFNDYICMLKPDARRELLRQYRRLSESTAIMSWESGRLQDVDEVVGLIRETAARYDAEFYYPEQETRQFLAHMADAIKILSIRREGERVGALICFPDHPRFHVWAAGMRYDKTRFSPYAISISEAVRYAIAHRYAVVEGGRGNARIKGRQGFVPVRLYACLSKT
jgi:predicted N-acyltransferase